MKAWICALPEKFKRCAIGVVGNVGGIAGSNQGQAWSQSPELVNCWIGG